MIDIAFGVVAAAILMSGLFTVRSNNLIRAVLWLAVTLVSTAALYALLDAPFLAAVQVLTYVGGVVTLMIFGVMVTRHHTGTTIEAGSSGGIRAFLAAAAFFGAISWALSNTDLSGIRLAAPIAGTAGLANALLDEYLLAFEVSSLLLLAAIVGAVVLARRRDPDPITGRERAARIPGATDGVAP